MIYGSSKKAGYKYNKIRDYLKNSFQASLLEIQKTWVKNIKNVKLFNQITWNLTKYITTTSIEFITH